jgi:geranylgeranyl pyrophosphate synthase
VGVELAHNASLVHDDIIDGDEKRRGELAYYIRAGIDNAILIGHKMLAIGFNIALAHGKKFAKLYVDSWDLTLAGQLKEVNFNTKDINGNQAMSRSSKFFLLYADIIDMKTATLFSAACEGAAYEANASEHVAKLLADYGRAIGLAYQLADDLVDLEKGEMIDSVILPLMNRLEKKSIKNGSMTAQKLKKKIEENSSEIKKLYLDEIRKHVQYAQNLSQSDLLPTNEYKKILQEAPAHIINQMLKEIDIVI